MPEQALTSFVRLLRSESRSRIEYLMLANNIIVLDSYFNKTNKSNLTDSL